MLSFGAELYQLLDSEARSQPVVQRLLVSVQSPFTAAANLTLRSSLFQIPADKIGILTNALPFALPGAGQNFNAMTLEVEGENNESLGLLWRNDVALAANATFSEQRRMNVLLMPREQLVLNGFFNAGVAGNFISLDLHILLLPRANLQRR